MRKRIIFYIAFFCSLHSLVAQTIVPKGNFSADSIKIGQPVKFILSYYHPANMELFFPDSAFNYAPFEFISKEYQPTRTNDSMSLDIAIYTLSTFEVSKSLTLSLPVYIIEHGDTLKRMSSSDQIFIKQFIDNVPDSLLFKSNTEYKEVPLAFNYPYWITTILLIISFLVIAYFVFGKAVLRNYRLYVMYNNHIDFLKNFDKLIKDLEGAPNLTIMEKVLVEWKDYLTKLEHKPINTFTSTEIISLFDQEELKVTLQKIDRSIYGGTISEKPLKPLKALRKFSNERYKKHRKELIRDGK